MNPASTGTINRAVRAPAHHRENANLVELNDANRDELKSQRLTIMLEGITASDYLAWVRDPDAPTLGRELRSVDVDADPLGDRIDVLLHWNAHPPAPRTAAPSAGFHLTPEVTELRTSHR